MHTDKTAHEEPLNRIYTVCHSITRFYTLNQVVINGPVAKCALTQDNLSLGG